MSNDIKRHHPGASLSRLVECGNLVFVAGTTADNRSASCKAQTEEVLKKIDRLLSEAGTNKSKILWANVWLTDMREKIRWMRPGRRGSTPTTSPRARPSNRGSARPIRESRS